MHNVGILPILSLSTISNWVLYVLLPIVNYTQI